MRLRVIKMHVSDGVCLMSNIYTDKDHIITPTERHSISSVGLMREKQWHADTYNWHDIGWLLCCN